VCSKVFNKRLCASTDAEAGAYPFQKKIHAVKCGKPKCDKKKTLAN
jgi:hypothetical protein